MFEICNCEMLLKRLLEHPMNYVLMKCLVFTKYLATGVKFKGLSEIQGLFEIIVGETIVKSPYRLYHEGGAPLPSMLLCERWDVPNASFT